MKIVAKTGKQNILCFGLSQHQLTNGDARARGHRDNERVCSASVVVASVSAYESLPCAAFLPFHSFAGVMEDYPQETRANTHGLSHAQA